MMMISRSVAAMALQITAELSVTKTLRSYLPLAIGFQSPERKGNGFFSGWISRRFAGSRLRNRCFSLFQLAQNRWWCGSLFRSSVSVRLR